MSETIKTNTTAPAAQGEQGKRAAQEPTVEQVAAVLMAQVVQGERLTAYQIHVLANLGFQILQIEDPKKPGETMSIRPQAVYNATKSIRAKAEAEQGDQSIAFEDAEKVLVKLLGRSGGVKAGERLDKAAILANAMKALTTK
jgi:hypothetical protein